MTPLSRLLQGCTDHTSGARMPPNPALLNGFVTVIRLGKAGTPLHKEEALEKVFFFFCHYDTTETSRVVGKIRRLSAATKGWGALILPCCGAQVGPHVSVTPA